MLIIISKVQNKLGVQRVNCYVGAQWTQLLALSANFSHSKKALTFKLVT